ncbi:MAG TPA: FHA domain-containing protein, partial [Polyangiaceae bacterium]|nr:FHA domain-containing protein [Polyangiaceae bacterium]
SFEDAKAVAAQLVASMGPNDIVDLMFFNDRQVVKDSKWLAGAQKTGAAFLASVPETFASSGRNRSLLTMIKTAATDGFGSLGNVGEDVKVPLHQAMVVLSSGFGGADPSTTGPGALQLQQYLTGGRFPEENTALPKTPVPVISIYFPLATLDEFRSNSLDFMQNLANPEIGGFFTVVQPGGGARAGAIIGTIRQRFSKMSVVRWNVACVAPSVTQTFKLFFNNMSTPLLGDNTFKDVPVGIDPTTWPLDVNTAYSAEIAKTHAVYPGGRFRIYGNFCWGGDKSRAEVYFLPSGQPLPTGLTGRDIEAAKRTQQQLIAMGMKGTAIEAADTYVEVQAPDNDKILAGSGEQAVVRMVAYDNRAHRTSGLTADTIISLKGTTPPLNLMLILGGAFGLVVLALLILVIIRGGSKKRPGAPAAAGAGYGAQGYTPQGYAAPAPAPAAAPGASPQFMYGAPGQGNLGVAAPQPQAAPPSPYGGGAGSATTATLQGQAGIFTVLAGQEMRAGRDASQCGIVLGEARVSAVHASLKMDAGQLWVRDENSNNGTLVNGTRISPGVWSPVPQGSMLRFGPVEFSARIG